MEFDATRMTALERIIDALPSLVYLKDTQNNFLYVNQRVAESLGVDREEIVGTDAARWYPEKAREYFLHDLQVIRSKKAKYGILEEIRIGQCIRWVRKDKFPVFDSAGEVLGILVIGSDLDEEKNTKNSLERSQRFLHSIVENIPNMIFVKDAEDLRFVLFNKAGEDLLGYEREDLIGKNDYDFFSSDQADFFIQNDRKVLEEGKLLLIEEEPIDTKHGKRVLRTKKIPMLDQEGTPLYLLGISEDITEAQVMRSRLHRREQQLSMVLEATNEGVWDWNLSSDEIAFSDTWCSSLGYTREEISPTAAFWKSLVHPDDIEMVESCLKEHLAGESEVYICENRLRKRDGTYRWNLDRGKVIEWDADGAPTRIVGVGMDISKQQLLLEEISEARNRAEDAAKTKSEFLAKISHELRTPLNGVLGMTELLIGGELSNEQREVAQTLKDAGESLLGIINDVLDFSRIEVGKLVLRPVIFNLEAELNSLIRVFQPQTSKKNIQLRLELDASLPLELYGDVNRIRQILVNLISNSLKFTDEGGEITLAAKVDHLAEARCVVAFSVQDTGIGIAPNDLERVFTSFEQVHEVQYDPGSGTGLGLAICAQLAELMGGGMSAESTIGEGSVFCFSVDLAIGSQVSAAADTQTKALLQLDAVRVLVVEDNRVNQKVASGILERAGCVVTLASDGKEALDLVNKHEFDVILMDIQMPVMNGMDATAAIRAIPDKQDLPIIALTAFAMSGDRERFIEGGMDDYVSKPLRTAELLQKIWNLIN